MVGTPAAAAANPSRNPRLVSELITQPWAITCIHVPVSEMAEPMM
jgi:hypothetical protein